MTTGFRRLVFSAMAVCMLALIASPALAQSGNQVSNQDEGIGIGVLAGIVRPNLTADNADDFFSSKTGTMFGLWVGGNRGGLIGFTGEFNYIIRKADTPGGELSFPAFQIPAVFHINFGSADRNKAMGYVVVGPSFTFNLSQKLNGATVPDQEKFKGADIGIVGGGGFEIVRIAVEVRGNWGLRTISSEGSIQEIKSRSIEFLVKFRFN
jgi:hypothetical protein